jgi:subtilisin family serine protease
MKRITALIIFLVAIFNVSAQDNEWPFLDTKAMEADQFIAQNPEYDGRGVVIFVLDNAVDPLIPGLFKTSTGEMKVIDMQDFSNQTVLNLKEGEIENQEGNEVLTDGKVYVRGWKSLNLNPTDGKYYVTHLNEEDYKNSAVPDINNNGKTTDVFAFVAFKIDNNSIPKDLKGIVKPEGETWVYYVDDDNDGHIDNNEPMLDYKYDYDTFDFWKGEKGKRPLITMSANVINKSIVINTCDGSHGSHCAGIAAGNDIYGAEGNDGVAPGAYVVSLKIGSNELSGGATTSSSMKKAYEYGIKFMEEAGFEHAVYSMSYGIGSETPNYSTIEKFLNKFAVDNPNVVIVNSNGNSGPGINSTGNPAGATNILSVGAMLPPVILKDLYGSQREKAWVTHFSSRGGETAKPDVVAPGGASSAVPAFEGGDRFWGTSMACPEVAGAAAVLISAAYANDLKIDGFMVQKAIKYTAKPLEGYSHVDQGNGLVNIPAAFEYLKVLSERKEYDKVLIYDIETTNTFFPDKKGPAAFWKSNGYFPQNEKQSVKVKAVFSNEMAEADKHNFYRGYKLKSNVDWLSTDRSEVYIRGDLGTDFGLIYDAEKLKKPGLYSGKIYAYPKNEPGKQADFDVQATIVIPYTFNQDNRYQREFTNVNIAKGDINRYFIETPAGASSMRIKLYPVKGKNYGMAMYLFSPDGNNHKYGNASGANNNKPIEFVISGEDLQRGIWEILPYCYYQSSSDSYYNLEVEFYGFKSSKDVISKIDIPAGDAPRSSTKIINEYYQPVSVKYQGSIAGYQKTDEYSQTGKSTYTESIKIGKDVKKIELFVDMANEEYNKVTDLAINIYDESGKAVYSSGMSRKYYTLNFTPPKPGTYRFEMVPGFTSEAIKAEEWKFSIRERYYYTSPVNLKFDKPSEIIYPGTWYDIGFTANGSIPMSPNGYKSFGFIELNDVNTDAKVFEQLIEL